MQGPSFKVKHLQGLKHVSSPPNPNVNDENQTFPPRIPNLKVGTICFNPKSNFELANKIVPASEYLIAKDDLELDLIALVKEQHEGSWDLQEEPSLQTAQDFPCEDDAVDGHVLDVPPEDRGKESECKQIDIASAKDAPNSSMNDEADAILNDDFGDDDDW